MEKRQKKKSTSLWIIFALLIALNWALLLTARITGVIDWSWAVVLLGVVWIPAGVLTVAAIIALALELAVTLKRWIHGIARREEVNNRIKAHAMAFGIWNRPQALGGKALDLCARENFGIKRKRGETDRELRRRCVHQAEEQISTIPGTARGRNLDGVAAEYGIERRPGESDDALRHRIIEKIQRSEHR